VSPKHKHVAAGVLAGWVLAMFFPPSKILARFKGRGAS
jgi:hypothetical protein